jgi:hypothetical protein
VALDERAGPVQPVEFALQQLAEVLAREVVINDDHLGTL